MNPEKLRELRNNVKQNLNQIEETQSIQKILVDLRNELIDINKEINNSPNAGNRFRNEIREKQVLEEYKQGLKDIQFQLKDKSTADAAIAAVEKAEEVINQNTPNRPKAIAGIDQSLRDAQGKIQFPDEELEQLASDPDVEKYEGLKEEVDKFVFDNKMAKSKDKRLTEKFLEKAPPALPKIPINPNDQEQANPLQALTAVPQPVVHNAQVGNNVQGGNVMRNNPNVNRPLPPLPPRNNVQGGNVGRQNRNGQRRP